jgi:hypothetical protein
MKKRTLKECKDTIEKSQSSLSENWLNDFEFVINPLYSLQLLFNFYYFFIKFIVTVLNKKLNFTNIFGME